MRLLRRLLDVRVDEKAVDLAVDVLDRDLEPVETPSLGQLDLAAEVARQVLKRGEYEWGRGDGGRRTGVGEGVREGG